MNKIVFTALFAAACAVPAGSAFAAQTAQQQRMATCSAQNKGKTGQDYKDAQKACLSGKAAPLDRAVFALMRGAAHRMPKAFAKQSGVGGDLAVEVPAGLAPHRSERIGFDGAGKLLDHGRTSFHHISMPARICGRPRPVK